MELNGEEELMSPPLSSDNESLGSEEWEEVNYRRAVQIVSITEDGAKFQLDEKALFDIFASVPEGMKVSIVSVVGAFRTGKSFILDLFLRYLRYCTFGGKDNNDEANTDWIYTGFRGVAQSKLEGNDNLGDASVDEGFSWRAGPERNTTGIWIWGEPFFRETKKGEKIAVFLLDTQGMFDSETSQMLTASIFGLSTLLSSYQIYNVDKRIQEDNLQHLALFTEYGRLALGSKVTEDTCANKEYKETTEKPIEKSATAADDDDELRVRPFQKLEFLVRDWQNFDENATDDQMLSEMSQYLDQILASRKQQDLADTREHINDCFEEISCWLLPHPGFEVIKKTYDGTVSKIQEDFVHLISKYCHRIFGTKTLAPKKIHGREVTAQELVNFIKAYANLFCQPEHFPEAKTLLEATAEANNVNVKDKALSKYKKEMSKMVGPGCAFVSERQVMEHHRACFTAAMTLFDDGANMGRRSEILKYRELLITLVEHECQVFVASNKDRDPYKNLEFYILPSFVALSLFVARITQDLVCYENIGFDIPLYDCKQVSVNLTHLYWAIITFMLIGAIATGAIAYDRVKLVVQLIQSTLFMKPQNGGVGVGVGVGTEGDAKRKSD